MLFNEICFSGALCHIQSQYHQDAKSAQVNWIKGQSKDPIKEMFNKESDESLQEEKVMMDCIIETIRKMGQNGKHYSLIYLQLCLCMSFDRFKGMVFYWLV